MCSHRARTPSRCLAGGATGSPNLVGRRPRGPVRSGASAEVLVGRRTCLASRPSGFHHWARSISPIRPIATRSRSRRSRSTESADISRAGSSDRPGPGRGPRQLCAAPATHPHSLRRDYPLRRRGRAWDVCDDVWPPSRRHRGHLPNPWLAHCQARQSAGQSGDCRCRSSATSSWRWPILSARGASTAKLSR